MADEANGNKRGRKAISDVNGRVTRVTRQSAKVVNEAMVNTASAGTGTKLYY